MKIITTTSGGTMLFGFDLRPRRPWLLLIVTVLYYWFYG